MQVEEHLRRIDFGVTDMTDKADDNKSNEAEVIRQKHFDTVNLLAEDVVKLGAILLLELGES